MENINFLNLNDSVNHNYHVNNALQERLKIVQLDEFDSGMVKSID